MKALVLSELKQPLVYEDCPDPEPGPGDVVVELRAAALNRRDYWITQGLYPGIQTPVILGSDGAGVVAEVGKDADPSLAGGEVIVNPGLEWGSDQHAQQESFRVLGMPDNGTFAEKLIIPALQIHSRPEHLSWHEAAALPLAGVTAYRAVFSQGQLKAGENVLISGVGGGVAAFALQFAVAAGANVFVTSSSDEKISTALGMGAKAGFRYTEDEWHKTAKSQHGPMHLIVDGAGGAGYRNLLDLAAPGGRIVNYGATAGPPPKVDLFKVFWKQLHLVGSTMGSESDFASMLNFVSQHELRPIVDAVYALADGNNAVESMKSAPQFGKTVLDICS